ncbi:MAG: cupin domain-containing protein [Alphaproteobacteria bacterium]|nr:cupin domain-containing protein [Alphaproteobacteria bacterium]MDX5369734.1 cupin domain-containing protein [Alphaproteobacteria bacterium]MDX5464358.1 cupin domain-containing protein [Alphaproteobacteria bacterium]
MTAQDNENGTPLNPDQALGALMRQARKDRSLSMHAVATRAGLSVGLISQIERGLTSPSIRSLRLLADAIGVPVESFFTNAETVADEEAEFVVRPANRRLLDLRRAGITMQITTPRTRGDLQMFLTEIEPGAYSGPELDTHDGEEAGVVIAGQLDLWLGEKRFHLFEGDAFRYRASTPHRYGNPGKTVTRVHWVYTPPIY